MEDKRTIKFQVTKNQTSASGIYSPTTVDVWGTIIERILVDGNTKFLVRDNNTSEAYVVDPSQIIFIY